MKPIILIAAYQGYIERGDQAACRDTYLKEWGHLIPHMFVYDREYGGPFEDDEMKVDAPTGFMECVYKTRLGVAWALANGFDYVFSVPTDCYIAIPRLLKSGFSLVDYTGYMAAEGHIGGGSGYWLSKHAMAVVAAATPVLDYEDRWVGNVLRGAGITPAHDARYWDPSQPWQEGLITAHLSHATGVYDPSLMRAYHAQCMYMDDIFPISPVQEC